MSKPKSAPSVENILKPEQDEIPRLLPEEEAARTFINRHAIEGKCCIECFEDKWIVFSKDKGHWIESKLHYYLPEIGANGTNAIVPAHKLSTRLVLNIARRVEQICQQSASAPAFVGAFDVDYTEHGTLVRTVINVLNGEVTLTPGVNGAKATTSFSPVHNPDRRFNRVLAVVYDPKAKCVLFDETRLKVIPHPLNERLFHVFMGSTLLPFNKFKTALVLYGPSDTCKSTLAEAACLPLGECRTYVELNELVNQDSRFKHLLPYMMCNISTELSSVTQEDSSTLKKLIACEPTSKRKLYQDGGMMQTRGKYMMCSNSLPTFKGGTSAESTRLRFIECKEPFAYVEELPTRLKSEVSGIFNYLLAGAVAALSITQLSDGDERSVELRAAFAAVNDPFGEFVEEWVEKGKPEDFVLREDLVSLYAGFRDWRVLSSQQSDEFWKRMNQVFKPKRTTRTINGVERNVSAGIRLKKPSLATQNG